MSMKYSFEQFYVWYQYGLTLMCDQKVKIFHTYVIFICYFFKNCVFAVLQSLFGIQRVCPHESKARCMCFINGENCLGKFILRNKFIFKKIL